MEKQKKEKSEKFRFQRIRCPYCNSRMNYFKLREKIWQCRNCGEEFKFNRSKLGHPQTEETKKIISEKHKNELNGVWKGDQVGYNQVHRWVERRKQKPEICNCCGEKKEVELANISGEYKRDVDDFEWLCRKCHMHKDGRMINNLNQFKNKK